jgi:hypothetical protein
VVAVCSERRLVAPWILWPGRHGLSGFEAEGKGFRFFRVNVKRFEVEGQVFKFFRVEG